MRKNFLKIASAATTIALALTIGVGNAVATDDDAEIQESSVIDLTGENATVILINNEYTEKFNEFYEEALDEGVAEIEENFEECEALIKAGTDPYAEAQVKAEKIAQEKCEELGLYSEVELTQFADGPYKGWKGTFEIHNVAGTTIYFNDPERFSCSAGGRTATITGKTGFRSLYKRAAVTITYDNGATSSNVSEGNTTTVSATAAPKAGAIKKGDYNLYMYNGDILGSGLYELAYITLIEK